MLHTSALSKISSYFKERKKEKALKHIVTRELSQGYFKFNTENIE